MKSIKSIQAYLSILFLIIILILSSSLVLGESIEEIMTQGSVHAFDFGSIYLLHPEQSYQRDNFTISLAYFQTTNEHVTGDIYLYRNGEKIPSHNSVADLENGDTYLLMEWNENLMQNASYKIEFVVNEEKVFSEEFTVQVLEKTIISRTVEQNRVEEYSTTSDSTTSDSTNLNSSLEGVIKSTQSYSDLEYETARENAKKHADIKKTLEKEKIIFMDNTSLTISTIKITIKPDANVVSMKLIEDIPKNIATNVSQLNFSSQPIILKDDPIIMWDLKDINETRTLSYEVEKDVAVTGNTVLLANVAKDQEKSFNWNILFALLLIPIIAGILIYFSKFAPKK